MWGLLLFSFWSHVTFYPQHAPITTNRNIIWNKFMPHQKMGSKFRLTFQPHECVQVFGKFLWSSSFFSSSYIAINFPRIFAIFSAKYILYCDSIPTNICTAGWRCYAQLHLYSCASFLWFFVMSWTHAMHVPLHCSLILSFYVLNALLIYHYSKLGISQVIT